MIDSHQITLAIESAIGGGSISLLRDDNEIANWTGTSNISKAEDLLANIDKLLADNNVSRHEIDLIAAAAGPGSFTGIRIGLATALGLKAGLRTSMSSESALRAMAHSYKGNGSVTVAVPVGRDAVCTQTFAASAREVTQLNEPGTVTEDDFAAQVLDQGVTFLVHSSLFEKVAGQETAINFGTNIALAVGLICRRSIGVVREPLFISKSF